MSKLSWVLAETVPSVEQWARGRYASTIHVLAYRRGRYSDSRIEAWRQGRYAAGRQVTAWRKVRYASTTVDAEAARSRNEGELEVDLRVDVGGSTHDLTGVPTNLQMTHGENQPTTWQISILDDTGLYHPERVGSPWQGVMDHEAFNPDGSYRKRFIFNSSWGGVPFSFVGIPTAYGHTRSFSSGGRFDFSWSGVDISRTLFLPGRTYPTLRTERGAQTWGLKSATADILTRCGIPHDLSLMEDAPIRVQHRQDGRPGDFFQQLLDVLWAKWTVRNGVLHVYQPAYEGAPQWTYSSSDLVMEDNLQVDAPEIINEVTARRAAEARAQSQTIEVDNFGQYTVSFNPPVSYVTWQARGGADNGGAFSDFIMRDPAGGIVAVREVRGGNWPPEAFFRLAIGIGSITFTWGARPNFIGSGWPSSIQFFGQPFDAPAMGSYDEVFSVTERDQASIDRNGLHQHELSANPLIFDSATLRRHALGFLLENRAAQTLETYRVPLCYEIWPGQRVRIIDDRLGTAHVRYIRRVTRSISDDPDQRFCRLETVRYA